MVCSQDSDRVYSSPIRREDLEFLFYDDIMQLGHRSELCWFSYSFIITVWKDLVQWDILCNHVSVQFISGVLLILGHREVESVLDALWWYTHSTGWKISPMKIWVPATSVYLLLGHKELDFTLSSVCFPYFLIVILEVLFSEVAVENLCFLKREFRHLNVCKWCLYSYIS